MTKSALSIRAGVGPSALASAGRAPQGISLAPSDKLTVFHIPICPFSQRLEILAVLKDRRDAIDFQLVDITKPYEPSLVVKTRGSSLPVLETEDGVILRESLVLMQYLEDRFPERPVAQRDPSKRALENMFSTLEGGFVSAGYKLVMNQDLSKRDALHAELLARYAALDAFLVRHAPGRTFFFDSFGWAEAVFTPVFMRFWFVEYYEDFELADTERFARVRAWREACLAHPAAQQTSREEIVKVYYDYAKNAGDGRLVPGRTRSSVSFEPHWSKRPWPPKDKYTVSATDSELGLI